MSVVLLKNDDDDDDDDDDVAIGWKDGLRATTATFLSEAVLSATGSDPR